MARASYPVWFLGAVSLVLVAIAAFNIWSDGYILRHRAGPSLETVSGFERVIKPAWLESVAPSIVFVGSSRIRNGFDPVLIDRAFGVRSFNYGVSSISAYETRRFVQDAAAHASVKVIVVALDAFSADDRVPRTGQGFDELRLAVRADGTPTANRSFWLFVARTLSGGALGMHALGLSLLAQLRPSESAADRPDLFEAYGHMTPDIFNRDLLHRSARAMRLSERDHSELLATLGGVCARNVRLILFFPPDNQALIALYEANDRAGLASFKQTVIADATRHNRNCTGKVAVFDFLRRNAITAAPFVNGRSDTYIDLVHFRPQVGVRLLRVMLGGADATLGRDLARGE